MIDEKEIEKIISCCRHSVKCQRGSFYPNKDYGSQLTASSQGSSLLSLIRQATAQLDGVYIKSVERGDGIIFVDMLINDEERRIEI